MGGNIAEHYWVMGPDSEERSWLAAWILLSAS